MLYDFYCMNCGKKLNQTTVLFDMQRLFSRNQAARFSILKYRMTLAQINELVASGADSGSGYHKKKLSFQDVMNIIANENNLNDAAVAGLKLEELEKYIQLQQTASVKAASQEDGFDDGFGWEDAEETPQADAAEPEEEYQPSEAMLALEAKDTTNTDRAITKVLLSQDLNLLQTFFLQAQELELEFRGDYDTDNDGNKVLVGLEVKYPGGNIATFQNRICSHCEEPVFPHAGTALHQAIAFIGYQSSGKTSTILSLTSYVENHIMRDLGSEIWTGCKSIPSVATIEVLGKGGRLQADLKDYNRGLAPNKTEANKRKDAYSVTFRLKNTAHPQRYYLLTLTDLPGELCKDDGTIETEKVMNHFPVAMSCDAFVACFDAANTDPEKTGITGWVQNVCKWTDEFQKMRAVQNGVETYVPTMLLFTKCKDLESGRDSQPDSYPLMPLARAYSLQEEKRCIDQNNIYSFVREQFNQFGQLHKAYHALMRGSPYGYAAPSSRDLVQEPNLPYHAPTPKNMDILMRWLLSVSGCIPTEAEFRIIPTDPNVLRLNQFCISRPQLRSQAPLANQEVQEALARCALFENPGKYDKAFVGCYDSKSRLIVQKLQVKLVPDGNVKEEP